VDAVKAEGGWLDAGLTMAILETIRARTDRRRRIGGFSLIELMIVVAIILIIAALAIPNFLQAKIQANQASAASTVRTINTASVQYSSSWSNGFPPSLTALGTVGASPSCSSAMVLDGSITNPPNQKSGYTFSYTPQGPAITNPPAGCTAGYSSYLITAMPNNIYTGTQSYCSDESFVLHYSTTGAAIATSVACESLPAMQ
jgi:type IV pilus assembly protein PilA